MKIVKGIEIIGIKLFYPSVSMTELDALPNHPGIYYAIQGFQVRYIGMASSLWSRWNGEHHQKEALYVKGSTRIYNRWVAKHRLRYEEAKAIEALDPDLNTQRPNPKTYLKNRIRLELMVETVRDGAIAGLLTLLVMRVVGSD